MSPTITLTSTRVVGFWCAHYSHLNSVVPTHSLIFLIYCAILVIYIYALSSWTLFFPVGKSDSAC